MDESEQDNQNRSPGPTRKIRLRNTEQLERKRKLDREAQKIRRSNSQVQMQQMEARIHTLQEQMAGLQEPFAGSDVQSTSEPFTAVAGASPLTLIPHARSIQEASTPNVYSTESSLLSPSLIRSHATNPSIDRPFEDDDLPSGLGHVPNYDFRIPNTAQRYPTPISTSGTNWINPNGTQVFTNSIPLALGPYAPSITHSTPGSRGSVAEPSSGSVARPTRNRESELDSVGLCTCETLRHRSYAECFEETVFQALTAGPQSGDLFDNTEAIPPMPDLADMLNLRKSTNLVTHVLKKIFKRQTRMDANTAIGAYFTSYLLLRVSNLDSQSRLRSDNNPFSTACSHQQLHTTIFPSFYALLACRKTYRTELVSISSLSHNSGMC
jgi:hypothetical protein